MTIDRGRGVAIQQKLKKYPNPEYICWLCKINLNRIPEELNDKKFKPKVKERWWRGIRTTYQQNDKLWLWSKNNNSITISQRWEAEDKIDNFWENEHRLVFDAYNSL